jgi:hypothetical protein
VTYLGLKPSELSNDWISPVVTLVKRYKRMSFLFRDAVHASFGLPPDFIGAILPILDSTKMPTTHKDIILAVTCYEAGYFKRKTSPTNEESIGLWVD